MQVIELGTNLPAGYATESVKVTEPEHMVRVSTRGFASTADGHSFVRLLEQFPTELLSKLTEQPRPSQVDNLLAIISPTGTANVYINEVSAILTTRVRRSVKAGQPVSTDDISEIQKMEFHGIDVPAHAGIIYFFSIGWRRGLFYDFGPLHGEEKQFRNYDLSIMLGGVYAQVLFQDRFSISEADWAALFSAKWFLFSGLSDTLIRKMIGHVQERWNLDELLDEIVAEVKQRIPAMLSSWKKQPAIAHHFRVVDVAIARFLADDHINCTSTLFTRIEGILRTHHRTVRPDQGISTEELASSAVLGKRNTFQSLVLPHRFEAYLNEVYFQNFNPNDKEIPVSRHSVSHGEAPVDTFDMKSSVISILIVDQLFHTF